MSKLSTVIVPQQSVQKQPRNTYVSSHISLISFISLLLPAYIKYFTKSLQESMNTYRKTDIIPHIIILAFENFTMWIIQQFLFKHLPNQFWVRSSISVFMIVIVVCNFFIYVADVIFSRGLFMRFGADIPLTYIFIYLPNPFDSTLPKEGQAYTGNIDAEFLARCAEAYREFNKHFVAAMIIFGSCIAIRLLYLGVTKIFSCFPSYKPRKQSELKLSTFQKLIIVIPTISLFIFYVFTFEGRKLDEIVPCHWFFYKSAQNQNMPQTTYLKSVKNIRDKYELPPNEDWLDQRETPIFPLVHAPKEFVRAYNNHTKEVLPERKAAKLPNIVFLSWESFSPAPKYVRDEVLLNEKSFMQGQPYRKDYLPNLAGLAETGHTFMAMRSNGIPTINGWHAFTTGEMPSSKSVNVISSQYNQVDDFPSKFREYGYWNLMVWPCNLDSDKIHYFAFRGKQRQSGPEFIEKFPTWFDEIHQFYPTKEEAETMGILEYPEKQRSWTADRISSQTFNYFFNKQVSEERPVFGFYGNVDTHEDFSWFDDPIQYEPYIVGQGRSNRYDVYGMHDAYSTVIRYSDAAFGRIIKNIKENAPETIVVIMGDHGTRQAPLYLHPDKKINEESEIYYDMECNHKTAGPDMQFTTSAVMSYFGTNEYLKSKFDAIKNMTTFEPADQQDVVHTIMLLLEGMTDYQLPSTRLGVDLLNEANNVINNKPTKKVGKISISHINMEYSDSRGLFRMALGGPKDGYQVVKPVPSCIQGKNSINTNFDVQVYKDAKMMVDLYTFMSKNDRYFSYDFRNTTCVLEGTCQFPEPNARFDAHVIWRFIKATLKITIKVVVILYIMALFVEIPKGIWFIIKNSAQNNKDDVKRVLTNVFIIKKSFVI
ncbi:Sulfatase [Hexamita inflata]|uniref:Sulfatase n=1 Tax=Hexamita inflata TaxID=28002 RepID=A0ABP1I0V9_9EUKA